MRLLISLASLWCCASIAAQVDPIWSSAESETVAFDARYGDTRHALLGNGDAFLLAGESSRSGLAATLLLTADGAQTRGQFGHLPLNGGSLAPERILATRGQRVLAGMTEREGSRWLVAMLDTAGQVLWVRPRYARQARFFADGDLLLHSGHELMRLDGDSGKVVWLRHLLEFSAHAYDASVELPASVDGSLRFAIGFRERVVGSDDRRPAPLMVSLDPATGATQWQLAREDSLSTVFQSCPPVELGADQVYAWHEIVNGQIDVVVERRDGLDGALLWGTRIIDVERSDGPCGLVATSSVIALSTHDEFAESTLVALDHAGNQQWRMTLPFPSASKLLAAPGTARCWSRPARGCCPGMYTARSWNAGARPMAGSTGACRCTAGTSTGA